MDRVDPNERPGKDAGKGDQVFCPSCAIELLLFIEILNTRNGQTFRLFRCECGEFVWAK